MNELIYLDMKIWGTEINVDLKFDGTMKVGELVFRVCDAFEIKCDSFIIISKRLKEVLNEKMNFYEQDVFGGDTLILIILAEKEEV